MENLCLLLLVAVVNQIFPEVCGQKVLFGSGITSCNARALRDQICPTFTDDGSANNYKYVRIKTYNGKYLWAEPKTSTDAKYVRTRCCGVKDVVGREDIKIPTLRSTFKVHCDQLLDNNRPIVSFEVLKYDSIEPSGHFLYARPDSKLPLYVVKNPESHQAGVYFVLDRWKAGTQTGIQTFGRKTWLSFYDDDDGNINVHSVPTSRFPIPHVKERFSIEIVSKECVETPFDQIILAAPENTSADDCEKLPDRCFVSHGWDYRKRKMKQGYCYYKKGSMCYKHQRYIDQRIKNPKDCESNSMCWAYHPNDKHCYIGADYNVIKM